MLNFIIGALKVIILLGTLITLHEFGHFIVAKLCNMKVKKFAIGFGPRVFKKQKGETEYSLRWMPLGGFVQLEGEDEESDDERSFSKRPIWQRLLVLCAGAAMNILIALIIYVCIYMNVNTYVTTKISSESDTSFLEEYNITPGDELLKINGHRVYNEYDVSRLIASSENDKMELFINGVNGDKYNRTVTIERKSIGSIGTYFENETVYDVVKDSASERAGLQKGDILLAVNGNSGDILSFINELRESPNKECKLTINREDEILTLKVTPEEVKKRIIPFSFVTIKDLDFRHNLYYAWKETKSYLFGTFVGFGELIRGKTENVEVQGIVGVSQQISRTQSLMEFFYLMSAISLSLGIMNLLPIPGLDGGKILITLIELVRGKPLKKEIEGMITMIGFGVLLFLIIAITFNDISNL